MLTAGRRALLSTKRTSKTLAPKSGFVKPDGPVCLVILDGVGLGDMQVRSLFITPKLVISLGVLLIM